MLATVQVSLTINGQEQPWAPGFTVGDALGVLRGAPGVVVEVNGAILPPEGLELAPLAAGDVVEIVHFVGGG